MLFYLLLWALLVFVFMFVSSNLLFSLLTLEIITFMSIFFFSVILNTNISSDFFLFLFFSFFVIEGVIGLCGFITLVFFSGCDYISSCVSLNL